MLALPSTATTVKSRLHTKRTPRVTTPSTRNGFGAETPSLIMILGTTVPMNALMSGMVSQTTGLCTTVTTASMMNATTALTTSKLIPMSTNMNGSRLFTALKLTLMVHHGTGAVLLAPWTMLREKLTTTVSGANAKRLVMIFLTATTATTVLKVRTLLMVLATRTLPTVPILAMMTTMVTTGVVAVIRMLLPLELMLVELLLLKCLLCAKAVIVNPTLTTITMITAKSTTYLMMQNCTAGTVTIVILQHTE
mmetsp:Transcript_36049/g.26284  ORF Transcript_36049/g.26284 Transcript_36049/m.26284 type:complete len:251 (+) Transcript_36049:146-898(+)